MKKTNLHLSLNYQEKSHSHIGLISSIIVLTLLVLILAKLDYELVQKPLNIQNAQMRDQSYQEKQAELAKATTPEVSTCRIIAAGDNMYLSDLLSYGWNDSDEWNYDKVYTSLKPYIQAADLAICSQENILTDSHASSTDAFMTPTEVGDALANAGFDVVAAATNHAADYGETFINQTIDFWNKSHPEVTLLGLHRDPTDQQTIRCVNINGISIALLNYTYGSNHTDTLEGKTYMVDFLEKNRVAADIAKAREVCDCVIVIAHWGTEDVTTPTEYQLQWASYIMQCGANVLIGTHPHVPQTYGTLSDTFGNSMLVYYSLGNMVTTQSSMDNVLGGLAEFTIRKSQLGDTVEVSVAEHTLHPLVMHMDYYTPSFGPYLLSDYTEELASAHHISMDLDGTFTPQILKDRFKEVMSKNVIPSDGTSELGLTEDISYLFSGGSSYGTPTVSFKGKAVEPEEADEVSDETSEESIME